MECCFVFCLQNSVSCVQSCGFCFNVEEHNMRYMYVYTFVVRVSKAGGGGGGSFCFLFFFVLTAFSIIATVDLHVVHSLKV